MTKKASPLDLQLLTVAEVAEIERISERQVRRQIARGELPHHKIGTAIRIGRSDLEIFLAQQRHNK